MADPRYVRLADHMQDSIQADVTGGSGWSISGRDVKPFPEEASAARFVRSRLVMGLLESAGKAEHQEVQEANKAVAAVAPPPTEQRQMQVPAQTLQEASIQQAAAEASAKLSESRNSGGGDEEEDDIDQMSSADLNTALETAGLSKTGKMEERRARLRELRQTPS